MRNNKFGFLKVATAVFDISIGGVKSNAEKIMELIPKAEEANVNLLVFPELCLTGYSCQDMFLRNTLASDAEDGLRYILYENRSSEMIVVIGMPIRNNGTLFNCAVVIQGSEILAIIPKTFIPNYGEFYEKRWFASSLDAVDKTIFLFGKEIPFGTDIIIESNLGMRLACEICEDLWVGMPPSSEHCLYGANVIANTSASNNIVTKKEYRKDLVKMQSAKCNCAYVYSSAGSGESTTDVVYGGHQIIASCGSIFKETSYMFETKPMITTAVIDLEKIDNDRNKMNSFRPTITKTYRRVRVVQDANENLRPEYVNPYPFIPSNKEQREERCKEIIGLQATGLATRLKKSGVSKSVIGISGGLDSTLAVLVAVEAYRLLGYPTSDIIGITMPGFGTTKRTKTSADRLMELLGIKAKTIDITAACTQHLNDIEHDLNDYDVTYENVQARERTQILMDVANLVGGLVIGTGDLSELALGWCTYNGDHMSMYAVNTSVPKTLVKYMIETYATNIADEELGKVLMDICETTISPELLPPDENGEIQQSTEQTIGKYDLHDFFLYNFVRNGFGAEKIYELAVIAFKDMNIPNEQIEETLDIFLRRFRQNQFKRSALPDGPKVGSVALSPRGDWRMPSDMG